MLRISSQTNSPTLISNSLSNEPTKTKSSRSWSCFCPRKSKKSETPFEASFLIPIQECFSSIISRFQISRNSQRIDFSVNISLTSSNIGIVKEARTLEFNDLFDRCEQELYTATSEENIYYCEPWIHKFFQNEIFEKTKQNLEKIIQSVPSSKTRLKESDTKYLKMLEAIEDLLLSFDSTVSLWNKENNLDAKTLCTEDYLQLLVFLIIKTRSAELLSNEFISDLNSAKEQRSSGRDIFCVTTLEAAIFLIKTPLDSFIQNPSFFD